MEKFGNIAYVIADSGEVPAILNHSHELEELFAVRVSINFLPRKVKYREVLGTPSPSPEFWIVGTDAESLKKEISRQIDYRVKAVVESKE